MLLVLNTAFAPAFVAALRAPYTVLAPLIAIFCVAGVYSANYSEMDLWFTLGFGLIGYLANKLDYPLAPLVLALALGNPLEVALRQSLKMSQTDLTIFFTRAVSGVIMAMAIAAILWPPFKRFFSGAVVTAGAGTAR